MCQILPARVLAVDGELAEIELHGGARTSASLVLENALDVGDHVLVDRGVVVKKVAPDEAAAILAIYAEMDELLKEADA